MRAPHERIATVFEIERGLHQVLDRLMADAACWIVIVEVAASLNRYVQFCACDNGGLMSECSSNESALEDELLTAADEARLAALGWSPPDLPGRPNWWIYHDRAAPTEQIAATVLTTLREIFDQQDTDLVVIKMFQAAHSCSPSASRAAAS